MELDHAAMKDVEDVQAKVRDLRGIYRKYLLTVATLGISLNASRTLMPDLSSFEDTSIAGFNLTCKHVKDPEGRRFTSGGKEVQVYRVTLARLKKEPSFFNKNKTSKSELFSMCVHMEEGTIDIFISDSFITDVYFSEENLPDISEYVASVKRMLDISNEYLGALAETI